MSDRDGSFANLVAGAVSAGRGTAGQRGRLVVVGSGKGGTGKTFLAANLAVQWSLWGQRVVLVDADLGLANLHVVLGLDPAAHLMGLLAPHRARNGNGADLLVPGPAGVQLLPGGSGIDRLASLNRGELRRLVARLEPCLDRCDVAIVDLSSGISASTLLFLQAAQEILLVSNPDPSAVLDAYAVIKVVARPSVPQRAIHLVMNRVRDEQRARHSAARLETTAERFVEQKVSTLGLIPEDGSAAEALAHRQPLVLFRPDAPATRAVRALARRLLGAPAGAGVSTRDAFFARSAGLLAPRKRAAAR
ncbi:MAG: MinD/ParA family protein [Acidobacteriota bacterium]